MPGFYPVPQSRNHQAQILKGYKDPQVWLRHQHAPSHFSGLLRKQSHWFSVAQLHEQKGLNPGTHTLKVKPHLFVFWLIKIFCYWNIYYNVLIEDITVVEKGKPSLVYHTCPLQLAALVPWESFFPHVPAFGIALFCRSKAATVRSKASINQK